MTRGGYQIETGTDGERHQIATNSDEEYNKLRQQSSFPLRPPHVVTSSFWSGQCRPLDPLPLLTNQSPPITPLAAPALPHDRPDLIFISSQTRLKSRSRRPPTSATRLPTLHLPTRAGHPIMFQTSRIPPRPEPTRAPLLREPPLPLVRSSLRSPPSPRPPRLPTPGATTTTP